MDFNFFAGLDEAGRGPVAGPVSAACVILSPDFPVEFLNDSKKLTERKREKIFPLIKEKCCWGHAYVEHDEIATMELKNLSPNASMTVMGFTLFESRREDGKVVYFPLHTEKF